MLNGVQRGILKAYLDILLDSIMGEDATLLPRQALIAMQALYQIFDSGRDNLYNQHRQNFNRLDILASIDQIRDIYHHPCPQNRRVGDPTAASNREYGIINGRVHYWSNGFGSTILSEPIGLMGLTKTNDDTNRNAPATKADIIRFILNIIRQRIELLKRDVKLSSHERKISELESSDRKKEDEWYARKLQEEEYSLTQSPNSTPTLIRRDELKKQAIRNYDLAKAAISKKENKKAIDYLFLAKGCFERLKKSGMGCDGILREIKHKIKKLQPAPLLPSALPRSFSRMNSRNIKPNTLKGHSKGVSCVCFDLDSTRIISGSYDGTIKIWDVETGRCVKTLTEHSKGVCSICVNDDFTLIVSGSTDKTVKLWDAKTYKYIKTFSGHHEAVYSVCINDISTLIASGSLDKTIKIWNVRSGKCTQTLTGHWYWADNLCFRKKSDIIASSGGGALFYIDTSIKLWNVKSGECIKTLRGHSGRVCSLCFSHDSALLASGGGLSDYLKIKLLKYGMLKPADILRLLLDILLRLLAYASISILPLLCRVVQIIPLKYGIPIPPPVLEHLLDTLLRLKACALVMTLDLLCREA